jgi:hypothetical protein
MHSVLCFPPSPSNHLPKSLLASEQCTKDLKNPNYHTLVIPIYYRRVSTRDTWKKYIAIHPGHSAAIVPKSVDEFAQLRPSPADLHAL